MNKFLFSIILVFAIQLSLKAQTTYYISALGDDNAVGTSELTPWKTLSKINNSTFASGDQILFRRGDIFYGKLRVNSSGLTFAAYGSGDKPVISGAQAVSDTWTQLLGNIWQADLASPPSEITNLFRADSLLALSRYPNKNVNNGYLNFETTSGKEQFTDNELTGNWAGAELVVRAERYRLVRTKVLAQSGNTISLVSNPDIINTLSPGRGYFFRNDLRAIDVDGEWAYSADSGKLYLQSVSVPTSILYSKQDTVVYIDNATDITFSQLSIRHGNTFNIYINGGGSVQMEFCDILYSGGDAVFFNDVQGVLFENNTVNKTNWNGVTTSAGCSSVVIQRNLISNIGHEAFGKAKVFYGIYSVAPAAQILNNSVSYSVGIGILAGGQNTLVKRNLVDHANTGLEDYGSIYTNYNVGNNIGLVIEENIVQNSFGEQAGSPADHSLAQGIYLDNNSSGVTVKNNTVLNIAGTAYFVGTYKANNKLENNTAYNAGENELWVLNPNNFPVNIKDNIFINNKIDTNHRTVYIRSPRAVHSEIGEFRDNFIVSPFSKRSVDVEFLENGAPGLHTYTPYLWNIATPNVLGASPGPIDYLPSTDPDSVILFYTNPSEAGISISLPPGNYVDARGQAYTNTAVLAPFSSIGLFKYSGGIPGTCNVPTGLATTEIKDFTSIASWQAVSDPVNYDLRYRAVDSLEWIYAYNIQDTTAFKLQGLLLETTYEWQVRSSCFGSESDWTALQVFTTLTLPPEHLDVKELLGSSAVLTWDPYKEAISYQVRYKPNSGGDWLISDSTSYTELFISELIPGSNYIANVRSKSIKGWSNWSDTLSFVTAEGGQIFKLIAGSPNHWLVRNISNNLIEFKEHATALFIGRTSNNQSGIAVFPFKLPALAIGQQITGADFMEHMDSPVLPIVPQLWGLPYRNSANYSIGDYYDGQFSGANQINATLIQNPWVDVNAIASNQAHDINLLKSGRNLLKSYFQQQYTNGAVGGEWAFLRINPTAPSVALRLLLDRTEDNDAFVPFVSLILTPLSLDIPAAATQVTASVTGTNSISLSWQDQSNNESGFIIEKKLTGGFYSPVDTLASDVTTFIDSNLTADKKYNYRVLAFNANGVIGYSKEASAKTLLSPPANLNGIIKPSNSIEISWADANTTEEGFLIERKTLTGDFAVIGTSAANVFAYQDTTASLLDLPYIYRLRAYSQSDTSAYSVQDTITANNFEIITLYEAKSSINGSTSNPPVYTNTLAANTSLAASPTFNPANLPGGCPYAVQANFIQSATTYSSGLTTYVEFKLKPGSSAYKLRITGMEAKARKAVGEAYMVKYRMAYSNDGVNFTDNSSDLIPTPAACSLAGYGTDFVKLTTQAWDIEDFEITNAVEGARFRIYYFNQPGGGNMGLPLISIKGSVIPVPDTLSSPTNLNAVIRSADNSIELNWNESNSSETGYSIERKSASAPDFSEIGLVSANTVFYRDTTAIINDLPYIYRIRAYSLTDTSTYSPPLTVTADDFEVVTLYQALSSVNGTTIDPPFYTNTLVANASLTTSPTFHPANLPGGCAYAVQANFVQAATAYSSGLNSYLEFQLKPGAGYKLKIRSATIKARKAVGVDYTMKYRLAYSNNGGTFVDNSQDLIPTAVGCSAAGYGGNFVNLLTQSWDMADYEVTDTVGGVRFRVYYFNQPGGGNMGLPLITINGSVIPSSTEEQTDQRSVPNNISEKRPQDIIRPELGNKISVVYPNPVDANQPFNIKISNAEKVAVKMSSVTGNQIRIKVEVIGGDELKITPMQTVPQGVYFVRIITEGYVKTHRVILK